MKHRHVCDKSVRRARTQRAARRRKRSAGATLVEVVVSTLLIGLVVVGALKCTGAVLQGRQTALDNGRARQLAQQLLEEILDNEYVEPTDAPGFGVEGSEASDARSSWDDVDDYHLWSAYPPQDRDGSAAPNSADLTRSVTVEWVSRANPATAVGSDEGVKRITVTVANKSRTLATETALRASSAERGGP